METILNIINDFPPEDYNLLVPVQSIQETNSIYKYVTNTVHISTDLDDREIYLEKNAKSEDGNPMYALTHRALTKLARAANGQVVEVQKLTPRVCEKCIEVAKATKVPPKCSTCKSAYNVAVQVTMRFPELSGGWQIFKATREIDLTAMAGSEAQKLKVKEFIVEQAESKAMSRCIRKALNIKSSYTLAELKKPFVVVYPVLDANDQDVKKALIAGQMAASNLLYGTGLQLNPGTEIAALPEGEKQIPEDTVEADYEVEKFDIESDEEPAKYYCGNRECGVEIQANVAEYSKAKYKMPLCIQCQRIADKKLKEKKEKGAAK